jgi:calcium-dependent protein kinase
MTFIGCMPWSDTTRLPSPTFTVPLSPVREETVVKQPAKVGQNTSGETESTRSSSTLASIYSSESADATFDTSSFVHYHHGVDIEKRYKIDMEVIACGGYGKVFKAEDLHCKNRLVAIKKIRVMSQSSAADYLKEAQIMQKLDHPGICKIFEVYQDGQDLFMVLEYLEGGELYDKIVSHDMTERSIADVVKQVACALEHSHSRGVAHCDLKPENICFCSHGSLQIKVIDWGLSSNSCDDMKSSVGTSVYAAPEVLGARGDESYTSACDLWSLGVLTYVMICGKPPFWGNHFAQLKSMRAEEYPMQSEEWARVSDSAKDFVRRLLKANPLERMTSENVLSHDFLNNTDDDRVHVTAIGRRER